MQEKAHAADGGGTTIHTWTLWKEVNKINGLHRKGQIVFLASVSALVVNIEKVNSSQIKW